MLAAKAKADGQLGSTTDTNTTVTNNNSTNIINADENGSLDPGNDPDTGTGGGVGIGTGIGIGEGIGSGSGGGEGNSSINLFNAIQEAPLSLSLLDKSGLDFEKTPLLSRILKL